MERCQIERTCEGFKILGLMTFDTVGLLYKQGIALFAPDKEVQFDFAGVSHVDSSAIALLLNWLRFAKKNNKNFSFYNLPGQLLEIANVCEVMSFLSRHINTSDSG